MMADIFQKNLQKFRQIYYKIIISKLIFLYIRPSGTEPKIKIYTLASAKNYNDALLISEKSEKEIITYIRNITK